MLVGAPGWRAWEIAGLLLGVGVLLRLNFRLDLLWTQAPLPLIVVSLFAVILLIRRVPLGVAILWLLGFLSYLWSLTPGDTLLAAVWGLTVVAAAAAGRWRGAVLLVVAYVVANDMQNALALNAFGLQHYLSGSVHYRLGAKALALVPVALAGFARGRPRWLALPWWLLATVATYGAVISGSRGVYVPLVLIFVLLAARLFRDRSTRRRLIAGLVAMAVLLVTVDALIPFHPGAEALGAKASTEAQVAAVSTAGGFTQRLRFWDQGLTMAVEHPFGVGLGSFRGTIHAFQRFPMTWSSSPHNVFVETAATLGWLGLAVLVVLLAVSFWSAWTSSRWPWALALLGIWFTLSVDVTADYPSILTIAFAVVGACLGPVFRTVAGGVPWLRGCVRGSPASSSSREPRLRRGGSLRVPAQIAFWRGGAASSPRCW
jgi:O-antigen ligase